MDQQSKIEALNRKIKELEEMMLNGEVESSENDWLVCVYNNVFLVLDFQIFSNFIPNFLVPGT